MNPIQTLFSQRDPFAQYREELEQKKGALKSRGYSNPLRRPWIRLCNYYHPQSQDSPNCPYLRNCLFAHNFFELLVARYREATYQRPFYKTRDCCLFSGKTGCPYGEFCFDLHGPDESTSREKTREETIRYIAQNYSHFLKMCSRPFID